MCGKQQLSQNNLTFLPAKSRRQDFPVIFVGCEGISPRSSKFLISVSLLSLSFCSKLPCFYCVTIIWDALLCTGFETGLMHVHPILASWYLSAVHWKLVRVFFLFITLLVISGKLHLLQSSAPLSLFVLISDCLRKQQKTAVSQILAHRCHQKLGKHLTQSSFVECIHERWLKPVHVNGMQD